MKTYIKISFLQYFFSLLVAIILFRTDVQVLQRFSYLLFFFPFGNRDGPCTSHLRMSALFWRAEICDNALMTPGLTSSEFLLYTLIRRRTALASIRGDAVRPLRSAEQDVMTSPHTLPDYFQAADEDGLEVTAGRCGWRPAGDLRLPDWCH